MPTRLLFHRDIDFADPMNGSRFRTVLFFAVLMLPGTAMSQSAPPTDVLARLQQWLASIDPVFKGASLVALGTVMGFLLKEFLFPRLFESWKSQRALGDVYRRYRDPLFLAASELVNRLLEICNEYPTNFLSSELYTVCPTKSLSNSSDDEYYRKYKFVSSIYRLCAFLGWLELYRQEIVFLDSGHHGKNVEFTNSISNIRSDFADSHLNEAVNWMDWSDQLLFREELRAIGEAMILVDETNRRTVIGYRRFSEIFLTDSDARRKEWLDTAALFLLDVPDSTDCNFRLVRLQRLFIHLVDLLVALERRKVPRRLTTFRKCLLDKLRPAPSLTATLPDSELGTLREGALGGVP